MTSSLLCSQKLISLCGLPGSDTEKEEAQFLLVVCSCVKQEPNLLRFILEVTAPSLSCFHTVAWHRKLSSSSGARVTSFMTCDPKACDMVCDVTMLMSYCLSSFSLWSKQQQQPGHIPLIPQPITPQRHHHPPANHSAAPSNQNLHFCQLCFNSPGDR